MMSLNAKIFLAGHRGLVGSALLRVLTARGYSNVVVRTRAELDCRSRREVEKFFGAERPEYVLLAAARVGGILANSTEPAEFIYDNLSIQTNVIDAAYCHGAKKLLFLGSSCIYPKLALQPISESAVLSGPLEPSNDAYAVAKIAGLKMCQAYRRQYGFDAIAAMPTNIYGPNDNFDSRRSHVLPALIRSFHEAALARSKSVTIWGSGTPRREFLHADDLAEAAVFLMNQYSSEGPINVGVGEDITILALAKLVAWETGFQGAILTDPSKPDGTPRKLLDVSKLRSMGWQSRITLPEGIRQTYEWYRRHLSSLAIKSEARIAERHA
jgi:GDP-L-fucose synthase